MDFTIWVPPAFLGWCRNPHYSKGSQVVSTFRQISGAKFRYYIKNEGVIFSGDLYLGDKIKYFRADEDIGTQIASLQKVLSLDFEILLCSHSPKRKNGKQHIQRKLDFLQNFYGNIISLWENGLSEKQIFSSLDLKENYHTKIICFGDVSLFNGVKSAIRHYNLIKKEQ
jgi:hypothetical protein